jgi:hypothetical protein
MEILAEVDEQDVMKEAFGILISELSVENFCRIAQEIFSSASRQTKDNLVTAIYRTNNTEFITLLKYAQRCAIYDNVLYKHTSKVLEAFEAMVDGRDMK